MSDKKFRHIIYCFKSFKGMIRINTRVIVIGALLAAIAAIFQLIPVFFTEIFVFLSIFSAIPIYIISRMNAKAGVLSYLTATFIIIFFSVHEGLFFLFTNGIVGLSLGLCCYYSKKRTVTWFICSIILCVTLSIMNYGIGIPVFGNRIPGMIAVQIVIIFAFSVLYNVFYYFFQPFYLNF